MREEDRSGEAVGETTVRSPWLPEGTSLDRRGVALKMHNASDSRMLLVSFALINAYQLLSLLYP